jgi:Lipase (class 3)
MKRVRKPPKSGTAAAGQGSRSKKAAARVEELRESEELPGYEAASNEGRQLPAAAKPVQEPDERSLAPSVPSPSSVPFDPTAAVRYGQFVQAAYAMYYADPNNITPAQPLNFPPGFRLSAWIHMQDFILGSTGPKFYGVIAQNEANANQFVLAIRGTANGLEWWDDANAAVKTTFRDPDAGSVASGFARIYNTLEVVDSGPEAAAAPIARQSMKSVGVFARQVSALVRHHAAAPAQLSGVPPAASVAVTGHSLGAALATLYAMDNAHSDQLPMPLLCTFASPRVGDARFAATFSELGLASWRVVNAPDIVPHFPPEFLGFSHIDTLQQFSSSGKVTSSPECWHSLSTYLSLIDTALQPDPGCRLGNPRFQPACPRPI